MDRISRLAAHFVNSDTASAQVDPVASFSRLRMLQPPAEHDITLIRTLRKSDHAGTAQHIAWISREKFDEWVVHYILPF